MKNLVKTIVLIALVVSCVKEVGNETVPEVSRRYELSFDAATKTELSGTGSKRQVNWSEGDAIQYYTEPNQSNPASASVQSVEWSVSQGSAGLSVSDDGVVVGSIATSGMVTVKVTDVNGHSKSANCAVVVKKNEVNTLTLSQDVLCLKVGETFDLESTLVAKDPSFEPTNLNVVWSTDNSSVATVSQVGQNWTSTNSITTDVEAHATGRMLAVSPGTATIKVTSREKGTLVATCEVEVLAEGSSPGGNEGVGFDNWNF